MLRYTKDRARPGLVALYDIRPGNGADQFLQPWSPHGASVVWHDAPRLTVTLTHCNVNQLTNKVHRFLPWPMRHRYTKFCNNSSSSFCIILFENKQTNKRQQKT